MAGQEQAAVNAARFVVTGGGGGGASGGSATGAFTLDRASMTSELANLRDLLDRITVQRNKARPMWSIESPGNDPASLRNTEASNKSGLAYLDFLTKQHDFVTVIIGKIETALGMHTANDEQAAQTVNVQGNGDRF
ncbi:hypothetical protein [Amycolatopsis sp. NPDC051372]|uniref:hypothetical protein n=1 Tax=Amycolatopsis sp. NPDC051372 TaxID=3155669 RepID=UPI003419D77E